MPCRTPAYVVEGMLNEVNVPMKIDTGAALSIITKKITNKTKVKIGDAVWVRHLPFGKDRLPVKINLAKGPYFFHLVLENGKVVCRYVDCTRFRSSISSEIDSSQNREATELLDNQSTSTNSLTIAPSQIEYNSPATPVLARSAWLSRSVVLGLSHSVVSTDCYGFPSVRTAI